MATRYADSKVTTDYEGVDKVLTGEWAFIKVSVGVTEARS